MASSRQPPLRRPPTPSASPPPPPKRPRHASSLSPALASFHLSPPPLDASLATLSLGRTAGGLADGGGGGVHDVGEGRRGGPDWGPLAAPPSGTPPTSQLRQQQLGQQQLGQRQRGHWRRQAPTAASRAGLAPRPSSAAGLGPSSGSASSSSSASVVLTAAGEPSGIVVGGVGGPAARGTFLPPSVAACPPHPAHDGDEDVVDTLDLTTAPDWQPRRRGGGGGGDDDDDDDMASATDDTDGATTDEEGERDDETDDNWGGGLGRHAGWQAGVGGGGVARRGRPLPPEDAPLAVAAQGGWLGGVKRRRLRRGGGGRRMLDETTDDEGRMMLGMATGWAGGEPAADAAATATGRRSWPRYMVSPGAGLGAASEGGRGTPGADSFALVPYTGPWVDRWRGGGEEAAARGNGQLGGGGEVVGGGVSVEEMETDGAGGQGEVRSEEEDLMEG
ncbi:hypothetical protein MMPV_007194 [Pyropia vietnamensis]